MTANKSIKSKLLSWFEQDKTKTSNSKLNQQRNSLPQAKDEEYEWLVYSRLVGLMTASVGEYYRKDLKQIADSYIKEKKNNYTGLAYIKQLEANYIYLHQCVLAISEHYNMFLIGQENSPKKDAVDMTLAQIRNSARDESEAHLRYLTLGCNGCNYHTSHVWYETLVKLRQQDLDVYMEEIEFGAHFFKAALTISQGCLDALWNESNHHLKNGLNLDKRIMGEYFYAYVKHTTECALNNKPLLNSQGELLKYFIPNQ